MLLEVGNIFSISPEKQGGIFYKKPDWVDFPIQVMSRRQGNQYWGLYIKKAPNDLNNIVPISVLEDGENILPVSEETEFLLLIDVERELNTKELEEISSSFHLL